MEPDAKQTSVIDEMTKLQIAINKQRFTFAQGYNKRPPWLVASFILGRKMISTNHSQAIVDGAIRRRKMRERIAELKSAAIAELERRGFDIRGKRPAEIRQILKRRPKKLGPTLSQIAISKKP